MEMLDFINLGSIMTSVFIFGRDYGGKQIKWCNLVLKLWKWV